jgi:uncharacterized protein (DUF885 family)
VSTVRDLADGFHAGWLSAHPMAASALGLHGYDADMPDASEAGDAHRAAALDSVLASARAVPADDLSPADAITLGCLLGHAEQELAALQSASVEHTVTAMPFAGPAEFSAIAARTVVGDAQAAADYLTRIRRSGPWIDQHCERLRIGAAKGRLPVAPLVEQAIAWANRVLAQDVPDAIAAPTPPAGWDRAATWCEERDAAAAEVFKPALGRWVALLQELLPAARPADKAGLCHLPGGEADYQRAVLLHTTLPLTAEQIHHIGWEELALLEERAITLGASVGLVDLSAVHAALRAASARTRPDEALAQAVAAVRRAEARVGEVLPEPLPPPCDVSPMPPVVATSGAAPHYTPPRWDGARPGTYWFNTMLPTAGTGWDLEGVAFHEAVPGHHLQFARLQLRTELPDMQRQRHVTVFGEGWGLYAEHLAEEMGLYSGVEGLLGATTAALMRAARLVLDTGLHAFGWSRDRAVEFFVDHVPLPEPFLASEVDRYIMWPGQALAYLIGKRELLAVRSSAQARLGRAFSLPAFHAAVLDSGSMPIPVVHASVKRWVEDRVPASRRDGR